MRLLTPFIRQRREGRRYCGGETIDGEWSYSMQSYWEKRGMVSISFRRRKEHARRLLVSARRGDL
jgi:hypothetical protein